MFEIFQNRLVLFGLALIAAAVLYKIFNGKDRLMEEIETEYNELLNSDKYKVKGQYSE